MIFSVTFEVALPGVFSRGFEAVPEALEYARTESAKPWYNHPGRVFEVRKYRKADLLFGGYSRAEITVLTRFEQGKEIDNQPCT